MLFCCPSTNVDPCELSFTERLAFFEPLPKPASIPVQAALGDNCLNIDDLDEFVDEFCASMSSSVQVKTTFGSHTGTKEEDFKQLENSLTNLQHQYDDKVNEIYSKDAAIKDLEFSLQNLQQQHCCKIEETQFYYQELLEREEQLAYAQQELSKKESDLNIKEKELSHYQCALASVQQELDEAREKYNILVAANASTPCAESSSTTPCVASSLTTCSETEISNASINQNLSESDRMEKGLLEDDVVKTRIDASRRLMLNRRCRYEDPENMQTTTLDSLCEAKVLKFSGAWSPRNANIMCAALYEELHDHLEQRYMTYQGKTVIEPRYTAFFGTSTNFTYKYSGRTNTAKEFTPLLHQLLQVYKTMVEAQMLPHQNFNVAMVNVYLPNQKIGLHADDSEEIVPGSAILSFSFGVPVEFLFTDRNRNPLEKTILDNGDILWMGHRCQEHYLHGVPNKIQPSNYRINITFRLQKIPDAASNSLVKES